MELDGGLREEARLNARGETLFLEKRPDRRGALARTDRVLRGATEELVAGYPAAGVLARLEAATCRGDALPTGRARACYDVSVGAICVGHWCDATISLRRARGMLTLPAPSSPPSSSGTAG